MALDDIQHVTAHALITRLVEKPDDPAARIASMAWLDRNAPDDEALLRTLRWLLEDAKGMEAHRVSV